MAPPAIADRDSAADDSADGGIHGCTDDLTDGRVVAIERMRRRDLRSVLRIEERTSSTPWSLGLFLAEVRRAERCYVVARDASGAVVGYAGMLFVLDEGHITTVAVDPDRQGGRIGTRIMVAMLRDAIVRGARNITLEVRASNEGAIALYRRFGFAPAGVRANYYSDPLEDALVLWANDVDTPEYAARLDAIVASLESALGTSLGTSLDAPVMGEDDLDLLDDVMDDVTDGPLDGSLGGSHDEGRGYL